VTITSTSTDRVRYRLESDAPYLVLGSKRGEFTGSTVLDIPVDPSQATAKDMAGSLRVITELGDAVVTVPSMPASPAATTACCAYTTSAAELGDTRSRWISARTTAA